MATRARNLVSLFVVLVVVPLAWVVRAQTIPTGGAVPPPTATVTAQTLAKLDPLLQSRLSNLLGRTTVIVGAQDGVSLEAIGLLVDQVGGTRGRPLGIVGALAADVPNASLATLANSAIVRRVALDRVILGAAERTGAVIGADAAREQYGLDGAGVGVAVIDSGVTSWHDDLAQPEAPGSQRVEHFVDFVNGQTVPYDDYGHGTHVAGIIAGNGFDSGGARTGIAPAATLTVLKVLDGAGRGQISNVIAAFDYIVANRAALNVRIINLSIAAGVYESYNSDFLTLAARRAVEEGIVVIAAAGNAGKTPTGETQYGAITAPGNAPWVLTVGASSHMGTVDRSDDTIAAFSSRGPTAIDRAAKPDLVAPGVGLQSLSAPESSMFVSKSPYLLNGTVDPGYPPYLSLSGTSQATPVVAGTVALLLQANPSLTPNAVKAILQYTAEARLDYDALTQGAGFLNARGAIELARFFAAPADGYPATDGWSRSITWGNHRVVNGELLPDASGWATSVVWGTLTTAEGLPAEWGRMCSAGECDGVSGVWEVWGTTCGDAGCSTAVWEASSVNVVWGMTCGGADCQPGTPGSASNSSTVWGSSDDGDTVVWGTSDSGDTVVWGTSCEDPSCTPVVWEE
jgi:serine protease AprX